MSDQIEMELEEDEANHPVSQEARYYTFSMDPAEIKRYAVWKQEHRRTCRMLWKPDGSPVQFPGGATGGLDSFEFTPTGLGLVTVCKCACGQQVNVTDYSEW